MENCSKQSLEVLSNPYSAKVELSGDIPSLQSLCCNIFNQPRTIQSSLQILIQFNQLCEEAEVSQHFIQVRDINYDYLIEKFDFLYEHYDKHLLRSAFGEDQFNRKVNSMQERLKIERRYKELKGTILEKEAPVQALTDDGYLPYESLISGVKWPSFVDPKRREDYLDPEEFLQIFNMTKGEFHALKSFKKEYLKKSKKLF